MYTQRCARLFVDTGIPLMFPRAHMSTFAGSKSSNCGRFRFAAASHSINTPPPQCERLTLLVAVCLLLPRQADPHPGNICVNPRTGVIGLLDWGQVKAVSDSLAVSFALMIQAMNSREQGRIVQAFRRLGVEVNDYRRCLAGCRDAGEPATLSPSRLVSCHCSPVPPPPLFCLPTVQVSNNDDHESIANVAVTMLDTRVVPGYIMDPFNPDNALKVRPV